MAAEVFVAVHQVAVAVVDPADDGHVGAFHGPIHLLNLPFLQFLVELPDVGIGREDVGDDRLALFYPPAHIGAVKLEGQRLEVGVVVILNQQVVFRVVDEFEVNYRREDGGIHARPFAVVVVGDAIAVLQPLGDGEAGPECGLVEGGADLADAAADPLDGAPADDDQAVGEAGFFGHVAQVAVKGELLAGGDDDAEELGGGAGNVVLALRRGAVEPGGGLGDQLGDAQLLGGGGGVHGGGDLPRDQRQRAIRRVNLLHEAGQGGLGVQGAAVAMGCYQHQLAGVVVEVKAGVLRRAKDLRLHLAQPGAHGVLVNEDVVVAAALRPGDHLDAQPAGQLLGSDLQPLHVHIVQRLLEVEGHRFQHALQPGIQLGIVEHGRGQLVDQQLQAHRAELQQRAGQASLKIGDIELPARQGGLEVGVHAVELQPRLHHRPVNLRRQLADSGGIFPLVEDDHRRDGLPVIPAIELLAQRIPGGVAPAHRHGGGDGAIDVYMQAQFGRRVLPLLAGLGIHQGDGGAAGRGQLGDDGAHLRFAHAAEVVRAQLHAGEDAVHVPALVEQQGDGEDEQREQHADQGRGEEPAQVAQGGGVAGG